MAQSAGSKDNKEKLYQYNASLFPNMSNDTETIQNRTERDNQSKTKGDRWNKKRGSHWTFAPLSEKSFFHTLSERKMRGCLKKCWWRQQRQMRSKKCNSSFCSTKGGIKYFNVREEQTFLLCQSVDRNGDVLLAIMSAGYGIIVINDRCKTLSLMCLSFLI